MLHVPKAFPCEAALRAPKERFYAFQSRKPSTETARSLRFRPPVGPGGSALAADAGQDDWSANQIVYTVDPADDGSYTVEADSTIAVKSITDIYGQPVTDYSVAYFKGDDAATATITGADTGEGATLDKRTGGMPAEKDDYFIVVFEGSVDLSAAEAGTTTIAGVAGSGNCTAQAFEVVAKADSIEGAFAFEYDKNAEKKGISDESWQYNGAAMNLGIALGNKVLNPDTDFEIEWTSLPVGVQPTAIAFDQIDGDNKYSDDILNAGTYTAKLTGKGNYKGAATVTFTVDAIDLAGGSIAIAPQKSLTLSQVGGTGNYVVLDNSNITVNGKALDSTAKVVAALAKVNGDTDGIKDTDELTEEGTFWAQINILTNAQYVQNTTTQLMVPFQVKKTAGYTDVAADAWYADSVYKAAENDYMTGIAQGIFAPEQAMTRAEFAKLVANMAGYGYNTNVTYPTQFVDVPANAWFAGAVEWAARYGIVSGTSETTFEPYGTVTREQIAAMLYRYAGDGAQVSDWAQNAMAWAVENGYVQGKGESNLDPQGTATRAEIAAIAVRVQPEAL